MRSGFLFKRSYYTIPNIFISISQTSFGRNCNKISFSNLPALKTLVNRHPIGCHTRCTRHSKILYFAPSEDQIFALNVPITRFGTVWCKYHRNTLQLGGTVIKFLSRICRLKNARESPSYRMPARAALAIPKFFTLRLQKSRFLLKTFVLHDSEQFDVNIIEIHFIWGEL